MTGSDSLSNPCQARCPQCGSSCFGRQGHSFRKTAGRGVANLHACRQHVWGSMAELGEVLRSESIETRKEVLDVLKDCGRCVAKIRRLGV
jgi:hypothetical protein